MSSLRTWLSALLVLALGGCVGALDSGSSSPDTCTLCAGESPLLRVTRLEYQVLLRDALGDSVAEGLRYDYLPSDGTTGPFASNALLDVDSDSVEAYRTLAESAGALAGAEATDQLACEASGDASAACIEAYLNRLGATLFRRALSADDRAPYLALYETARAAGSDADGVRMVVTAMLQSVHFLYRVEIGRPTEVPGVVALTGDEVAVRLANFLWRSAPDEALLDAARDGRLDDAEGVMDEARRMLADPRSDVSIGHFHTAWLGMEQLLNRNIDGMPEFADLRDDMLEETRAFSVHVFRADPSLTTLLTADYTVGSPELATFYGADPPDAMGLIHLDPTERAGILTHAGYIASHTTSAASAGVHRGRSIRTRFLCQSLPTPPPIDMVIPPDPTLSARQQLTQKTSPAACAGCHRLMNPTGFLFEHYDRAGAYRDMDGIFPVDATGAVNNSDLEGPLDGAVELSEALSTSTEVERCIAHQWLRYALGRELSVEEDGRAQRDAFFHYIEHGRDLRELVVGITGTDAFRHRRIPR